MSGGGAAHKTWKIGSVMLLLLLSIQFTMNGFFRQKAMLKDQTPPYTTVNKSDRKVIFLMVDALREDFVEFDTNTHRYLDLDSQYAYKGQKLRIFKDYL